jgi:uncharacterized lipoprotein YmbA
MNTRVALVWGMIAAGGLLGMGGGCKLLPEPQADPTRYYVLTARAGGGAAIASAAVQVRPVEVASYLRNRPLVVRRGEHEIAWRDYARWGEPLEQGIGRVLLEELRSRGVAAVAAGGPGREGPAAERQLTVRVLACEGAADGAVLFRATWELATIGPKPAVTARGEHRAAGLQWDGKTEAALVARLSEAIGGLASEIAGALAR